MGLFLEKRGSLLKDFVPICSRVLCIFKLPSAQTTTSAQNPHLPKWPCTGCADKVPVVIGPGIL